MRRGALIWLQVPSHGAPGELLGIGLAGGRVGWWLGRLFFLVPAPLQSQAGAQPGAHVQLLRGKRAGAVEPRQGADCRLIGVVLERRLFERPPLEQPAAGRRRALLSDMRKLVRQERLARGSAWLILASSERDLSADGEGAGAEIASQPHGIRVGVHAHVRQACAERAAQPRGCAPVERLTQSELAGRARGARRLGKCSRITARGWGPCLASHRGPHLRPPCPAEMSRVLASRHLERLDANDDGESGHACLGRQDPVDGRLSLGSAGTMRLKTRDACRQDVIESCRHARAGRGALCSRAWPEQSARFCRSHAVGDPKVWPRRSNRTRALAASRSVPRAPRKTPGMFVPLREVGHEAGAYRPRKKPGRHTGACIAFLAIGPINSML